MTQSSLIYTRRLFLFYAVMILVTPRNVMLIPILNFGSRPFYCIRLRLFFVCSSMVYMYTLRSGVALRLCGYTLPLYAWNAAANIEFVTTEISLRNAQSRRLKAKHYLHVRDM